ncbi:hypothetical protein FB451DRAFT_1184800 [Mycena latifolia]|nr:hypothetical protein FB451DRAFT_1184800 [Mycena latifolia]
MSPRSQWWQELAYLELSLENNILSVKLAKRIRLAPITHFFPRGTTRPVSPHHCQDYFPHGAIIAHKMNRGPGGAQPKMHDTINPTTGEPQQMVYPEDFEGLDDKSNRLAGKAKGMEQVLLERDLLKTLVSKNGRVVGVCSECKKSQAARDKAAKEAKAREDEIEGSGIQALGSRGVSETETDDLERSQTCCMQCVLVGLNIKQAAYAVKKYPSHRRIPAYVSQDEEILSRA